MNKLTGAVLPARSVMDGRAGGSAEQRQTPKYKGVALANKYLYKVEGVCPILQLNREYVLWQEKAMKNKECIRNKNKTCRFKLSDTYVDFFYGVLVF